MHLRGCYFYVYSVNDNRQPLETQEPQTPSRNTLIYTVKIMVIIASVMTLLPAICYSFYELIQVRIGWMKCHCKHNPASCDLGRTRYAPPIGCGEWKHDGDGRYRCPGGSETRQGRELPASSARMLQTHKRLSRA